MSLESKIDALTQAIASLTTALNSTTNQAAPIVQTATIPAAPIAPAPVPQVPVAAPVMAPAAPVVPAAAPQMPAPPTFMAPPVQAAPVAGAPFSDGKGLVDYVMNKYKALGAEKGAMIQSVLTSLGYANINDVKPEHYAALYQGVEALG